MAIFDKDLSLLYICHVFDRIHFYRYRKVSISHRLPLYVTQSKKSSIIFIYPIEICCIPITCSYWKSRKITCVRTITIMQESLGQLHISCSGIRFVGTESKGLSKNWHVYRKQMSAKWTSLAKSVAIFHLAPFWLRNYGHNFMFMVPCILKISCK